MLTLTVLVFFWVFFLAVSYAYFEHLFRDLGFKWSLTNQWICGILCIAGPAAMVLALCVDATRPLHGV